MKCVPYSMYTTSKAQTVGARKKWRATTSQVTATVMGTMSHAVTVPVQLDTASIAWRAPRNPGPPARGVAFTGGAGGGGADLREGRTRGSAGRCIEQPGDGACPGPAARWASPRSSYF